jgi:hypothetical protein
MVLVEAGTELGPVEHGAQGSRQFVIYADRSRLHVDAKCERAKWLESLLNSL